MGSLQHHNINELKGFQLCTGTKQLRPEQQIQEVHLQAANILHNL